MRIDMELWIRSQDRRYLIKTEYLYMVYDEKNKKAYIGDKMAGHIGKYKTKERALEVLDEIQSLFIKQEPEVIATKDGLEVINNQINSIVYEMPKE